MNRNKICLFQSNGKIRKIASLMFYATLYQHENMYFYDPIDGKWGIVIMDPDFEGEMTTQNILEKNVPALYKTQLLLLS